MVNKPALDLPGVIARSFSDVAISIYIKHQEAMDFMHLALCSRPA